MMKLKPVVIQKASEEGTRGEGQPPFGKWRNVTISSTFSWEKVHGKRGAS
jgi:hypothetical protein